MTGAEQAFRNGEELKYSEPTAGYESRFRISMQILIDAFADTQATRFFKGKDFNRLEGIRHYREEMSLDEHYLYIIHADELEKLEVPENHCSMMVLGKIPDVWTASSHSMIEFPEDYDILQLLNRCEEVFEKNRIWSDMLRDIMLRGGSIDDLCRASIGYFHNPLFVHDAQFYMISCPVRRPEMISWEENEETGEALAPAETINEFRLDGEYRETMMTKGAQIFSASLRGYRDIYVNLWDDYGRYEGRLVICELDSSLKPGQFEAAEYLAGLVAAAMTRRNHRDKTWNLALEHMLTGLITGSRYSTTEIEHRILPYGWKISDPYVCVHMDNGWKEHNVNSLISMCNHIDALVVGSKAFVHDESICIVINLHRNHHHTSDIAYFLREGLMKAGVSNVFRDFAKLGIYYRQASEALRRCLKNNDTRWSLNFQDIALEHIMDSVGPWFEPEYICCTELLQLKESDAENDTDLYHTLVVYIHNERNTVKTAQDLYIGRSTLFYRLRKIHEVCGLDINQIEDPKKNLYMRISIYLLNRAEST